MRPPDSYGDVFVKGRFLGPLAAWSGQPTAPAHRSYGGAKGLWSSPCQGRSRRRRWPKASLYKGMTIDKQLIARIVGFSCACLQLCRSPSLGRRVDGSSRRTFCRSCRAKRAVSQDRSKAAPPLPRPHAACKLVSGGAGLERQTMMPFSLGRMGSQGGRTNLRGGISQPQSGAASCPPWIVCRRQHRSVA